MIRRVQSRGSAPPPSASSSAEALHMGSVKPSRKLSRGKTGGGMGFLSRRSVKKTSGSQADSPSSEKPMDADTQPVDEKGDAPSTFTSPSAPSIIPDPLSELPAWFHKHAEMAVNAAMADSKVHYPMHNPVGPRYYRNHHLYKSPQDLPPIFPGADRSQESTRLPAHSPSPSGSPLPTPSSSQIRIGDPTSGRLRTRKLSQTAHDEIDLWDVTDPMGINFHHHSPYDIGLNSEWDVSTTDADLNGRPRRMSLTNSASRHKTVAPSPLSQSTSAIHLHNPDPVAYIPRRLSKRRKPFVGLFGSSDSGHSAPKSPMDSNSPAFRRAGTDSILSKNSRRKSMVVPPVSSSLDTTSHLEPGPKEKHGSVFGRLAKRFSVMRKAETTKPPDPHTPVEMASKTSLKSTKSTEPGKRVPPPVLDSNAATDSMPVEDEQRSSASVDIQVPSPWGKLTIANPDDPSGSENTPMGPQVPLPAPSRPEVTIETNLSSPSVGHEQVLDVPMSSSPTRLESAVQPPSQSVSPLSPASPPIVMTVSPPSPPLPQLPLPTPAPVHQEHSLPPTPVHSAPPSPVTEQPTFSSPGQTYIQDTMSHSASMAGFDAYNHYPMPSMDDSPLSRASIIANPPTPYASPRIIPPKVSIVPMPQRDGTAAKSKDGIQHVKSSGSSKHRQTETFKLVRSPSGGYHQPGASAGEVIMGMGEQWEVVESPVESPHRSKTKDSSRSPREHDSGRRDHSSSAEDDEQHRRHRSTSRRATVEHTTSASYSTRTPSTDGPRHHKAPENIPSTTHKDNRSSSRHRRESETDASRAAKTSDLNTFKAKDAWEMERLYKARSVSYGPNGAAPPTIGSDSSRASTVMSADMHRAGTIPSTTDLHRAMSLPVPNPGSNHTYFVVQSPYQGAPSTYTQIPSPPPPIIYSPVAYPQEPSYSSQSRHKSSRSYPDHRVAFPRKNSDPPSLTRNFVQNRLPDPPRVSPYQASPLPPSIVGTGSGTSSPEYWQQYAGVTTRY